MFRLAIYPNIIFTTQAADNAVADEYGFFGENILRILLIFGKKHFENITVFGKKLFEELI